MQLERKIIVMESQVDCVLDYNYNYPMMKALYEVISVSNIDRAKKLHDYGFKIENKIYKLFTHQLYIEGAKYTNEGIIIKKGMKAKLIVSGAKDIVKDILIGIVEKGSFRLLDANFKVKDMLSDNNVKFNNITLYRVRNPIVASVQNENKKVRFKSPYEEDYFRILANNLKRKYRLIYGKEYTGELYFDIEDVFTIKRKLIEKIKGKSLVIGYSNFELYIQADKDMQKVAYYCGIGSNNSLGMGMVTFVTSRRA